MCVCVCVYVYVSLERYIMRLRENNERVLRRGGERSYINRHISYFIPHKGKKRTKTLIENMIMIWIIIKNNSHHYYHYYKQQERNETRGDKTRGRRGEVRSAKRGVSLSCRCRGRKSLARPSGQQTARISICRGREGGGCASGSVWCTAARGSSSVLLHHINKHEYATL